jgi:hypothetical protein
LLTSSSYEEEEMLAALGDSTPLVVGTMAGFATATVVEGMGVGFLAVKVGG